jgi:hydrogenase maturation protein HypF
MYPDLITLHKEVEVSSFAETFLLSAQAPILLLKRKSRISSIAPSVAPESPYLGVFLPYTPLHVLLLHDLGFPVVATSGNLTDEPIAFQDSEWNSKLKSLCDGVLTHDRAIEHHADDSVVHVIEKPAEKLQMLRRARGYTPLPVLAKRDLPPILALGGHLNSTFAMSRNQEIILSPHLGDMESYESREVYKKTLDDFLKLYQIEPAMVAHDLHPNYFTTHLAEEIGLPRIAVQHHHAHLACCMLENNLETPVLGLTWDGTGYGPDQTVWGGEFLIGGPESYKRIATLVPFRLPAGEKAIHETWRTALSLLWETFHEETPRDLPLFQKIPAKSWDLTLQILQKQIFSPVTTSIGRLFDGVSAILGLSYYNTHQAEAAQMLEYAAWRNHDPIELIEVPLMEDQDLIRIDWREMVRVIVRRWKQGASPESLAAAFHESLAQAAMQIVRRTDCSRIAMAGGVFCNRYLTERLLTRIQEEGREGYIHSQLPPTDGGLAVGQMWVAAHQKI